MFAKLTLFSLVIASFVFPVASQAQTSSESLDSLTIQHCGDKEGGDK
ncbi:MAG: hypothetical protein SFT81_08035 [Candidatus Caenarcaniphilales bacterium]|nr:hypothetical protein [Candidatus Caenarcaniphilales bacterium]